MSHEDLVILKIEMASSVTVMMLVLAMSLLQGVGTTAQATTEELLTELDKPSEYSDSLLSF
jgi:hypothetical protein